MQKLGPRDIIIYWPGPRAFSVVQKPWGWAHILVQKPRGARRGMVTSQIDTCISNGVVPSLMGNVCMCSGQSEEAGGGHEHRETIPTSFRQASWFILRADRDTGLTA